MKNLVILVKMQLKEQLNFKRLDVKNVNMFKILLSVLTAALKFALVIALSGVFLWFAKTNSLFSLGGSVPSSVISIIFYVMVTLAILSCMTGLTKSIYYARDNAFLLTLPCSALQVYLSKLFIFFVFEVKRNMSFLVPLFIAYYALHGYPKILYLRMLVCMVAVSLFTVALGAILSVPAMWVSTFVRRHRSIQICGIATCVTAAIVLVFWGISLIPETLDLRDNWTTLFKYVRENILTAYTDKLSGLYKLTLVFFEGSDGFSMLCTNLLRFGIILGSGLFLLGIGILAVCPLFYKMASTPFEYLKSQVAPKKNRRLTRRFSAYFNEFLITLKSTNRMVANIGILVSVPMLIFLLNKIFYAMNTNERGNYMIVAFNVLIILLVILNANCQMASIFSRDGRSSYLIKTHPAKYILIISAKLLPNTFFGILSLGVTGYIIITTTHVALTDALLLIGSLAFIYLSHMLFSAELDLMNPQIELYATVGQSESNPNELKSTVTAFIISFAVAIASLLLLMDATGGSMYLKIMLVAFVVFVWRARVFLSKIKVYYKEK